MDNKKLSEQLRELASDNKERTKTAQLLDVIDDVEAALSAGVSRSSVVEKLSANGLEMSLNTFSVVLNRIRKKRGRPSVNSTISTKQKINKQIVVESDDDLERSLVASHDPRDIDKIMGSTPDLEAYSNYAKQLRKNKMNKS